MLPDDWRIIRHVRLRSLRESPEAFVSTYQREVGFDEPTWRDRATTCQWFVATADGDTVGVAGGVDGWSDDPADRELVGMWVAPSHRGQGVARRLLDAVGVWAAREGATVLRLGVMEGNRGARSAYLHMGLHPSGEMMEAQMAGGQIIEVMTLNLIRP